MLDLSGPENYSFSAAADSFVLSFETNNPWTARGSSGWIEAEQAGGEKGKINLKVKISENTSYDSRLGFLLIESRELKKVIYIAQQSAKGLSVSRHKYEIDHFGGEITIPVKSNVKYECTIDENSSDWLGIISTRALESHEVIVQVAPYEGFRHRIGLLKLYGEGLETIVEIDQAAPEVLYLEESSYTVDASSNTIEVNVMANSQVSASTAESWISISMADVEDGAVISLAVEPNYSVKKRVGTVTVSAGSIVGNVTVTQQGYTASDYSADRQVKVWQRTDNGRGGNFVIMGDGFSDRMIADGTYDDVVQRTVEAIFAQEPYASLRHMINVYSVYAVSPNEGIGGGASTALGCYFYGDRMAYGDTRKCINYAMEAVDEAVMDQTVVVVVMNSTKYAGVAGWEFPAYDNDYGDGLCVAFFTMYPDDQTFVDLLQHEACGHGFAKLADEYDYYNVGDNETAIYEEISQEYDFYAGIGWYKNIDYRSDPSIVKWSRFIQDERYSAEKLGVFEGAGYYVRGAYRPTQNSLMRTLGLNYNAPSREAIYYRINKLYHGADWQYDYETFVQQDLKNIKSVGANTKSPTPLMPLNPPIVMGMTWREYLGK